jgi:hypothetical protein
MLDDPEEGHSLKVSQEKWWIADGGKPAADIADEKNKEDDVKGGETVFIDSDPWPNKDHGRSGGAQEVCSTRRNEEEDAVGKGCGFALRLDENSSGNDEERSYEDNKTDIFMKGANQDPGLFELKQIMKDDHDTQ